MKVSWEDIVMKWVTEVTNDVAVNYKIISHGNTIYVSRPNRSRGDMRSLHIMVHDQRIRGWISGVEAEHIDSLWWDYDLRDPDTLDLLQGRLVEFAQTRAKDLRK